MGPRTTAPLAASSGTGVARLGAKFAWQEFGHFPRRAGVNKGDSIRGPLGGRNSASGTKSMVGSFESIGEDVSFDGARRERDGRERDVSLPRLKTGYGNKREAGRKGKVKPSVQQMYIRSVCTHYYWSAEGKTRVYTC